MNQRSFHWLALGLSILFLAAPLAAQFENAAVLGTVRDASGGVLTAGKVTLENVATGVQQTTVTDANGNHQFPSVRIGKYRV